MRKKYEHMIKVREILTPEQRDSYDMRILAKSRWERGDDWIVPSSLWRGWEG